MMKGSLLWALALAVLPIVAGLALAGEPELPRRSAPPPGMVLARMSPSGELILRIIDIEHKPVSATVTGYKTVEKTVDGVTFKEEREPFSALSVTHLQVPTGCRRVPIDPSVPYGFFDTKGMPVTREKAAERLTKETAVLLSNEPVESFHLLTAKEDALILVVPERQMPRPVIRPAPFEDAVKPTPADTSAPAVDEPQLPKQLTFPPTTALAQMSPQGDLELRLIDEEAKQIPSPISTDAIKGRTSNGTARRELLVNEFENTITRQSVPSGWRRVTLQREGPDRIFDTKGKPVPWEKAAERLAKESAVLIHYERIDPFQLLTAREDTLLVVVPAGVFAKKLIFAVPGEQSFPLATNAMFSAESTPEKPLLPPLGAQVSSPTPFPTALPLPKPGLVYLETGFAQATDNDALVLKLIQNDSNPGVQKAKYDQVNPAAIKEANATVNLNVDMSRNTPPVSRKWRLLAFKFGEPGFAIHDRKGNSISKETAQKMLAQETPVLISSTAIDPIKLLVMKDDGLVLVIPAALLYPEVWPNALLSRPSPLMKPSPIKNSEPPLLKPTP